MTPFFRRLSIRAQMILLVLAVALPAAAGISWFILVESKDATDAAYLRVKDLADDTAAHLDVIMRDYDLLFTNLTANSAIRSLDPKRCAPLLAEYLHLHPEFNTLTVRDAHANPVCTARFNVLPAAEVRDTPWFRRGMGTGEFSVGDAELGYYTRRWVSVLTHQVHDDAGRVAGLVSLPLDLLKLNARVLSATSPGALVTVADRKGNILLRSIEPEKWIGQQAPAARAPAFAERGAGYALRKGVDGVSRLYAFVSIPSTGWRVVAGLPEDEVFALHRERLWRSILLGAGALLLWLWLAVRVGSAIVKPIRDLAGTVQRVAAGDTAARASTAGPEEIGAVADEFNRMLDARAQVHAQLRQLTARLNSVHETESGLLSRELHDEFGQMLTSLKMDLSWIASRLGDANAELKNKVASSMALVDASVQSVRSIAARLRPRILDELGLIPAIEWLVQDFRERSGINTALVSNTRATWLSPAQATAVFRIVQESLSNIARHANANRVDVSFHAQEGWLTLEIRDNGKGVRADEAANYESVGLLGMRERALAAGGELTLKGVEGRGTVVSLHLPMQGEEA